MKKLTSIAFAFALMFSLTQGTHAFNQDSCDEQIPQDELENQLPCEDANQQGQGGKNNVCPSVDKNEPVPFPQSCAPEPNGGYENVSD